MIARFAEKELVELASQFKAVAIIGPRQSGKTTLARHVFGNLPYVSLENPDTRRFALDDPRGFLAQYSTGAIFDEAQRVPELFSYLQEIVDSSVETGRFIITGSNNFLLQESISQSLAGRIAYMFLLPFSANELIEEYSIEEIIFKGLYPPIHDQPVEPGKWFANYIRTYIERDVRLIKNISDLNTFERFIRLCAGRVGQLLNMNSLALEAGVDNKTVASWIGILESSFILYRLKPHHANFNKRVVKMSKLYFYDTGLACSLLSIQNKEQLALHPIKGSLFENFVINELVKNNCNRGKSNNLYFWRDNTGHEIDIVIETSSKLIPIEIKSGKTITPEFINGLVFWQKITGSSGGIVIFGGELLQHRSSGIDIIPWNKMETLAVMK